MSKRRPGVKNTKKAPKGQAKATRSLISIVIPTMKHTTMVRDCVQAVHDHTKNQPYEIIIVDDGSAPEVQEYLAALGEEFDCQVVLKPENEGFSTTCNTGIRAAQGEHVVLMNNDVLVQDGWLTAMVKVAEKEKDVGLVGARLLYGDGRIQHAGVYFDPKIETAFCHVNRFAPANSFEVLQQRDGFAVTFALVLITRKALDTVGLMDEGMFCLLEDIDYCLSTRMARLRVVYCPRCVATHLEGATRETTFYKTGAYLAKRQVDSLDYFFGKWVDSGISTAVADLAEFEQFCRNWTASPFPKLDR